MVHDFVVSIREGNSCAGRGRGGLNTEERVQRVGDSLDLLDLEVLNGTEVKDSPICGTDLEESRGHEINQVIEAIKERVIE